MTPTYDNGGADAPEDVGPDPGETTEATQDDEAPEVADPGAYTEPVYDEGEHDPEGPPVGDDDDGEG